MHAPAIRPRSAIEIVDASFSIFRNNFATMAVIGLAASVPFVLLFALGFGALFAGSPDSWGKSFLNDPMALMPLIIGGGLALMLWFAVVDGAMTFAAAEAYHGTRPSPGDAIRGSFSKGLSLIGGNILRIIIIGSAGVVASLLVALLGKMNGFLGFVCIIALLVLIPHLIARTFAITSAVVIERRTAMDAVTRSFALSKDNTLRIVGVGLLCLAVYWVAQLAGMMVVQGVVGLLLRSPIVSAILGNVVGMIMYPFLNIALMVLYFDQRVRKEGYDLDVLSSAMGGSPASPAPQG